MDTQASGDGADPTLADVRRAMDDLAGSTGFSGVVRVDVHGQPALAVAYGLADRRHGLPCTVDTQFGIASGTKGLTALTVVSLIEDGQLSLTTSARSLLGTDLPLIADDVTVEHLLAHRSGIGDYLDENNGGEPNDYTLTVPVHELATTEQYLAVLDGFPTAFAAGTEFVYCNGGYVVLALLAERAAGTPFHDLVRQRVTEPAGMRDTAFLRSDELPGRAAVGYLTPGGLRTNVMHLPVRGSGDGGVYSTVADVRALWEAFQAGRIVPESWVAEMARPRSVDRRDGSRYGLGLWLERERDVLILEGADVGVSFRTLDDPTTGTTCTVVSNVTDGAWDMAELVAFHVLGIDPPPSE